jgi:hypothetical protein
MVAFAGLLAIAGLVWLGSIYIFSKEKLPTPLRYLFYSGLEFLIVGIAVGPLALNLFPFDKLSLLDPLIHMGLGWVGLFLGLQLRFLDLSRVRSRYVAVTFLQSLFTGLAVGLAVWPFIGRLLPGQEHLGLIAITVLAASAALSSPTVLYLLHRETGFKERVIRLLHLITNLDGVVSVFAVGIAFTLFRPDADFYGGAFLLLQAVAVGVILGYLFMLFPRKKLGEGEMAVVLLGFVLFTSGAGGMLQVSPLFLNLVTGTFLANALKKDDPFFSIIINAEKPLYVVMLITAGLLFTVPGTTGIMIALIVVVVRFAAKHLFMSYVAPKIVPNLNFPRNISFSLTSQGAMALVVGFAYLTAYPGPAADTLFSAIILSVVINEIAAPYLVATVFKEA